MNLDSRQGAFLGSRCKCYASRRMIRCRSFSRTMLWLKGIWLILLYKPCYARKVWIMSEQREKIATNIRKGVLEYCVLGTLASGDKYGWSWLKS